MSDLTITVRPVARGCVLALSGELDFHTSPQVHRALAETTPQLQPGQLLVMDLGALAFCDSSGLTTLIAAYNRTQAQQASLALAEVSHNLARILRLVGLDQILPTYDTVETATAAQP